MFERPWHRRKRCPIAQPTGFAFDQGDVVLPVIEGLPVLEAARVPAPPRPTPLLLPSTAPATAG